MEGAHTEKQLLCDANKFNFTVRPFNQVHVSILKEHGDDDAGHTFAEDIPNCHHNH